MIFSCKFDSKFCIIKNLIAFFDTKKQFFRAKSVNRLLKAMLKVRVYDPGGLC